jgi:hypothetical protein
VNADAAASAKPHDAQKRADVGLSAEQDGHGMWRR